MLPNVSICLLTYNRVSVLPRSIDSLLAQSHPNFELIINDDCSSDETASLCTEYQSKDSRIRYFCNSTNQGYAGNQNIALRRATSDLIAIVHDGDFYRYDCVEKWVSAIRTNSSIGLVYNASDAIDENGRIITQYRHPYPSVMDGRAMIDEMLRLYASPIFGITMFRRQLALNAGGFDESYPVLADVDLWMRLLLMSDVAYINEPLFQIHPREKDHVNRGVNWRIIEEHYEIFKENAVRRFSQDSQRAARSLSDLRRKQRVKAARAAFWCLRHGKFQLMLDGLSYLKRL
jgi:glycosyltransferase involved in cell wall biosynthesis